MTHLKLTLSDEDIDFGKLTFPPLVVGEYHEGPRNYPAVLPAERVVELHGTGVGFDVKSLAVTYLWRGKSEPSPAVLAEVEQFNADPVRGWATLIREEAERNGEHWREHLREAQDYVATAEKITAAADALLAVHEDRTPEVGDAWALYGEPESTIVLAEVFDGFVLGIPLTTGTASATEIRSALRGKPVTLWPQVETGLNRGQLRRWLGAVLTADEVREARRWAADRGDLAALTAGDGDVDRAELEALCDEYQRRCFIN